MPSWQSNLITLVFRIRRVINPPSKVLEVNAERKRIDDLAANFKPKVEFSHTKEMINNLRAEWVIPSGTLTETVILYLHGGSFNSGSIKSHLYPVANVARAAQARTLLLDYRLAPENPFPAALEDALSAYRWLLANGHDPQHIVIVGDSSGGGLAVSLLLKLRDTNEPLPAAAVCLSPWTDLTCTGETYRTNIKKDVLLDHGLLAASAQLYLGELDPRTPLASPLYADLRGLPPLLIQAGSAELLLADSTCLAENARIAGVDVTLEVWEGMQHEWHFAANILPEARRAIARIGEFVRQQT